MIRSHGGFELAVDRLVSCCRLLLTCSVNSLIIVHLDEGNCVFTFDLPVFEWLYILDPITRIWFCCF